MIRLKQLDLDHVKNVDHGSITFHTLPSGGSVTGIYGANGSGKTTVIEALDLLKYTMSGDDLTAAHAGSYRHHYNELVSIGSEQMHISALFVVQHDAQPYYVRYSATYSLSVDATEGIDLVEETVYLGRSASQMGRPVIVRTISDGEPASLKPSYLWRSVLSEDRFAALLANRDAYKEHRSYLFSDEFLNRTKQYALHPSKPLSDAAQAKLDSGVNELFDRLAELRDYATNKMHVLLTERNAAISYSLLPIFTEDSLTKAYRERTLDLLNENVVPRDDLIDIQQSVERFNKVLPTLVPGMTLRFKELSETIMPDGHTVGVRIVPLSVREGREIPLRNESEGIIRLVGMLTHLIRVYNDPDSFVAIDELDTGVFEFLLGEILREFCKAAQGQLVFTAHNLRALERMEPTSKTIVISTLERDKKFIPFFTVGRTNNPRRQYLEAIASGGDTVPVYRFTSPQLIGAGFTLAGSPTVSTQNPSDDPLSTVDTSDLDALI